MREYFHDIIKPAVKAFKPGEVVLSFLLTLVPIVNIFTIPGYFFNSAGYIAKGKSRLPKVRLSKAFYTTLYVCATVFLLGIFGWLIVIAIMSPAWLLLLISKQMALSNPIVSFLNLVHSLSSFTAVFVFLFLIFILPIVLVRLTIYRYFSRILDFRHILRLVLSKEYMISFIVVSLVSLLLLSTGMVAYGKVATFLGSTPYVDVNGTPELEQAILNPMETQWNYTILNPMEKKFDVGAFSFLYFIDATCFFIVIAIASVLFGRSFYILETEHKIDHIPKHAKSEIKPLKTSELE